MGFRQSRWLVVLVIVLHGFVSMAAAESKVILVPKDFESIQDAVNFAEDGDEIHISPGDYTSESVTIHSRRLTLRGRSTARKAKVRLVLQNSDVRFEYLKLRIAIPRPPVSAISNTSPGDTIAEQVEENTRIITMNPSLEFDHCEIIESDKLVGFRIVKSSKVSFRNTDILRKIELEGYYHVEFDNLSPVDSAISVSIQNCSDVNVRGSVIDHLSVTTKSSPLDCNVVIEGCDLEKLFFRDINEAIVKDSKVGLKAEGVKDLHVYNMIGSLSVERIRTLEVVDAVIENLKILKCPRVLINDCIHEPNLDSLSFADLTATIQLVRDLKIEGSEFKATVALTTVEKATISRCKLFGADGKDMSSPEIGQQIPEAFDPAHGKSALRATSVEDLMIYSSTLTGGNPGKSREPIPDNDGLPQKYLDVVVPEYSSLETKSFSGVALRLYKNTTATLFDTELKAGPAEDEATGIEGVTYIVDETSSMSRF